jgi:hypothetical protein
MQTQFRILTSLRPFAVAVMLFALLFGNFQAGIILAQGEPPPHDGGQQGQPCQRTMTPLRAMGLVTTTRISQPTSSVTMTRPSPRSARSQRPYRF